MADDPIQFREEALAHYQGLEQLDHAVRLISPRAWIVLLTLISLVIALIGWGIWGKISTRVVGRGHSTRRARQCVLRRGAKF